MPAQNRESRESTSPRHATPRPHDDDDDDDDGTDDRIIASHDHENNNPEQETAQLRASADCSVGGKTRIKLTPARTNRDRDRENRDNDIARRSSDGRARDKTKRQSRCRQCRLRITIQNHYSTSNTPLFILVRGGEGQDGNTGCTVKGRCKTPASNREIGARSLDTRRE